jgi:hypothetical protein
MYGRVGGMKGKSHKTESKIKIGQSLKGREISEEHANKISDALTGISWINNGLESKRIHLDLTPIPDGWQLGMLPEHLEKMREGKSGENHWAYGQSMPEGTKAKISQTLTGRIEPESTRQKKSESSKRRTKTLCEGCGKMYYSCHKRHHTTCGQPNE